MEEHERAKLEAQIEDNIFLNLIKFGLSHPNGFCHQEIVDGLELNNGVQDWERDIVEKYLHSAYVNARETKLMGQSGNSETPFLLVGHPRGQAFSDNENRYTLTFDAHFKFIDYQELRLARENAKEAKKLSMYAIGISVSAILVSLLISLFWSQNVRIDPGQFRVLNEKLQCVP